MDQGQMGQGGTEGGKYSYVAITNVIEAVI